MTAQFGDKKEVFDSPYEQYAERNGQPFEVLREIDSTELADAEVLPMYAIRFPDGIEIEAWPEEVFHDATTWK